MGDADLTVHWSCAVRICLPLLMATGMAGSGATVLVSNSAAWAVSACAGKVGHLIPLGSTLGDNSGASWRNTTGEMAWQKGWGGFLILLEIFAQVGCEPL